ncbi:MAG: erythromycin esterase family protein [Flavobacteriales bacterium]|jgi:erythromycin esterase
MKRVKWFLILGFSVCLLTTRLFAMTMLDEPFLGFSIEGLFNNESAKDSLDSQSKVVLKTIVKPIRTVNEPGSEDQYIFLKDRLRNVEVFGIGEATHGSKEFFQIKSDYFMYLVKEHSVRLFGIEANFAACYDINKYVLYGDGDAKDALMKNGYWVWKSQEVLDFIEWMRFYNSNAHDSLKLQFYGYDMQNASSGVEWLEKYFLRAGAGLNAEILISKFDENVDELRKFRPEQLDSLRTDGFARMDSIHNILLKNKAALLKSDSVDFYFAQQVVETIKQKLSYFRIEDFNRAYSYRDSSMAENIRWIRNVNGGGKIMLWAHNGHIGKGSFSDDFKSGNWMGTHLKNLYGKAYFNIGFSFNEGGFCAHSPESSNIFYLMYSFTKSVFKDEPWPINENFVEPYKKSILTQTFSQLGSPIFFLDFEKLSEHQNILSFVNKEYPHYEAGAVYIKENSALWTTNLYELFDAIIYIDKVMPAKNFRLGSYD